MLKKRAGGFTLFQAAKLSQLNEIDHFFSGKDSGFEHIGQLTNHLNLSQYPIVVPKQTHTDCIAKVTAENCRSVFFDTDAVITNEKGIVLVVKTADCVPILLFDPVNRAIAAVHSGWRGTAKNIVGKAVQRMMSEYGSDPKELIAAIGPCISTPNYEVGEEVIQSFRTLFPSLDFIIDFSDSPAGKGRLNLKEANRLLLMQQGLPMENIEIAEHCTFTATSDFFSARRDGAKTGRMINGIVLK
jgi:YfiH family protein